MKRWFAIAIVFSLLLVVAQAPLQTAAAQAYPEVISLPNGFPPEGIAIGRGSTLYAGNRETGAIYQADLRTGDGEILVPAQTGRLALGLKHDSRSNYLFVAGGMTGNAYIYNAGDGSNVAEISLTTESDTFVNDVVITRAAAFFTDSRRPVLYKVSLGEGGALGDPPVVQEIPLSGDFVFVPGQFNANGIDASANGKYLIVVNSTVGALYRVDPETGEALQIDLGGASVLRGDGILLRGKTLFVVQNAFNQVAEIRLDEQFTTGELVDTLTQSNFDIPTTIAAHGDSLYVVNARFSTPVTPTTTYTVVKIQ